MSKKGEDLLWEKSKDEEQLMRKLCVRFNGENKELRDFKDAVAYLFLRGVGCPRKEAILFASKDNCRVDSTKETDGPKDFRTLKPQTIPSYLIEEGWLYGQKDYELGKCFPHRYASSQAETMNNEKMEDTFNEEEVKMRRNYKEMINRMKEYVKQINLKYDFQNQNGYQLVESVKKIVMSMKKELDNRHYLILNSVRFYDIAENIAQKQKLTHTEKNNLIEKLNVFSNFENEHEFQQQSIFKVDEEELNKGMDEFQQRNSTHQIGICDQEQQQRTQVSSVEASIQYASQLKNLESATKLLEEFDRSEGEEINKPVGRFDRSYANEKRIRQEQMKTNLKMVREETQSGLEGQFNQQKYFFSKEQKKQNNIIREQKEKEDLLNYIFNTYCRRIDDQYREKHDLNQQDKYSSSTPQEKYQSFNPQEKYQSSTPQEKYQSFNPQEKHQSFNPQEKHQSYNPQEKQQSFNPQEKYQSSNASHLKIKTSLFRDININMEPIKKMKAAQDARSLIFLKRIAQPQKQMRSSLQSRIFTSHIKASRTIINVASKDNSNGLSLSNGFNLNAGMSSLKSIHINQNVQQNEILMKQNMSCINPAKNSSPLMTILGSDQQDKLAMSSFQSKNPTIGTHSVTKSSNTNNMSNYNTQESESSKKGLKKSNKTMMNIQEMSKQCILTNNNSPKTVSEIGLQDSSTKKTNSTNKMNKILQGNNLSCGVIKTRLKNYELSPLKTQGNNLDSHSPLKSRMMTMDSVPCKKANTLNFVPLKDRRVKWLSETVTPLENQTGERNDQNEILVPDQDTKDNGTQFEHLSPQRFFFRPKSKTSKPLTSNLGLSNGTISAFGETTSSPPLLSPSLEI